MPNIGEPLGREIFLDDKPVYVETGDGRKFSYPVTAKDKAMNDVVQALIDRRKARATLGAAVMRTELSLPHDGPNGPRYRPQLVECERIVREAEERLNAALQALENAL